MLMATVKSQWLKKTILQRNLPTKQKEDVKALLSLSKTVAGNDIYIRTKQEILRIYAPKPMDAYKKALTRQMIGLPSQLGHQIINDVCKKPVKLDGCCCDAAVGALWSLQLPANVRAHISDRELTKDNYKEVFESADKCHVSAKQVSVAALMTEGAAALDETLPAFSQQNQPQVAAVSAQRGNRGGGRGRGTARGGRGGGQRGGGQRGGGQSGGSQPNQNNKNANNGRGPRHSSNPPDSVCDRHFRHGGDAWYCLAPTTCPWVSRITPK